MFSSHFPHAFICSHLLQILTIAAPIIGSLYIYTIRITSVRMIMTRAQTLVAWVPMHLPQSSPTRQLISSSNVRTSYRYYLLFSRDYNTCINIDITIMKQRTVTALAAEGKPYQGVLYTGKQTTLLFDWQGFFMPIRSAIKMTYFI